MARYWMTWRLNAISACCSELKSGNCFVPDFCDLPAFLWAGPDVGVVRSWKQGQEPPLVEFLSPGNTCHQIFHLLVLLTSGVPVGEGSLPVPSSPSVGFSQLKVDSDGRIFRPWGHLIVEKGVSVWFCILSSLVKQGMPFFLYGLFTSDSKAVLLHCLPLLLPPLRRCHFL